jgi:hypothetical protein
MDVLVILQTMVTQVVHVILVVLLDTAAHVIQSVMDIVAVAIILAMDIQIVFATLRNLDTLLVLVIPLVIVNHVVAT